MGYLIQRPESHCVHHRMGVHYYNPSGLLLWDIVFDMFRNTRQYLDECGFEGRADRRDGAMLAFAEVNASQYGPGSPGVRPPDASDATA